ncbi:MAG: PAS domain-containing protein [Alphaproteobacteria bacterium]|nr:PAS domain-containing protein [Alphaproteobacteria bacterium]
MVRSNHIGNLHPIVQEAFAYWNQKRGNRTMPRREDIDPIDIPSVIPHIILIDVDHDPLDFRFRLIGTYVDRHVSGSYTGLRHRDIPRKGPGSDIWNALENVARTGEPHVDYMGYHGPVPEVRGVEEAILPLGHDGRITMMMNVLVFIADRNPMVDLTARYRQDWPIGNAEAELFRISIND